MTVPPRKPDTPITIFDDFASRWVEVCARCQEEAPEFDSAWCVFCNLADMREPETSEGGNNE